MLLNHHQEDIYNILYSKYTIQYFHFNIQQKTEIPRLQGDFKVPMG